MRQCDDVEELSQLLEFLANAEFPKPTGERIAIIGSGPAGLAAGHDLALMGFRPTIFEMEPQPAGMLYTGVPGYRLPRELIRAEVAVIQSLGVEIRCNTQVGKDVGFTDLRHEFAALIIACGAKRSRALPIPNVDAIGVMGGVDFLRDVSLGKEVSLGQRVIVIGGGNVAYDVARTVLRQEEYDVSRTAARMNGRGGVAPEIGNPVFQRAATDEFIIRTIRNGRVATAMPAFQRPEAPTFGDQDIADVLAYLRTLGEQRGQKATAQNVTSPVSSGGRPCRAQPHTSAL